MDKANDYDVSEAEVIGRGAYGTVYLCKRKSDGRQIIFKVIIALKKLQKLRLCVGSLGGIEVLGGYYKNLFSNIVFENRLVNF